MDGLALGRIVHYVLLAEDAHAINRRRTTPAEIQERLVTGNWPAGAQAHIGNTASPGQVVPAMIVGVTNKDTGMLNLRCFLDGNDDLWVSTKPFAGDTEIAGYWNWPPRV